MIGPKLLQIASIGTALAAWSGFAGTARGQSASPSLGEIRRILDLGNEQFARGEPIDSPLDEGTRRALAERAAPYAIVVTTSDSRVPPELVFHTGLGELYVIRVAGGVCDAATLASIEFAASALCIETCVIMAHDRCEAMQRADLAKPDSEAEQRLFDRLTPALQWATREGYGGAERLQQAIEYNAHRFVEEAMARSPLLRGLAHQRRFQFLPASYDSATGRVSWLTPRALDTEDRVGQPRDTRVQRVRGVPPHIAMRLLQAGHLRFLSQRGSTADFSTTRRGALAEGQRPFAVVVTDADARIAPELLFDVGLGELYVIRVAGNFLDDEVQASVEHAIERTGASLVVVIGHDRSSAIELAIARGAHGGDEHATESLRQLFSWLEPSILAARAESLDGDALVTRAAEFNCARFLSSLRARSPLARESERAGLVALVASIYSAGSGDLRWLDLRPQSTDHRPEHQAAPHVETIAHPDRHDAAANEPEHAGHHAPHQSGPATHGATAAATSNPAAHAAHDPHDPHDHATSTATPHEHDDAHAHSHDPSSAPHADGHATPDALDTAPAAPHDGEHADAHHPLTAADKPAAPPAPLAPVMLIGFGVALGGIGLLLFWRQRGSNRGETPAAPA